MAVALGLGTPARADSEGHHKREHHVITIGEMSVHPRTITISADDVIVFVNYASKPAQVEFPGDVASKFTCPIRPTFHMTGKGSLVSRELGPNEFAMPCQLEPGEYEYRILGLFAEGPLETDQEAHGDPHGKIVVK